ncbi:uncharacterized protein [Malus domestica]|uniref:uncharacterized protein n=1 Tax=Malus domestica TaxID=3750 RepID=UPI0039755788
MKVLFWNIRGIGNDDSRTELSNICRLHHSDLVCIAEPMVTFNSISAAYWDSLNLSALTFNSRGTLAPNLWLLTSSACADPLVISISDQQVTVHCTFDHIPSQFTFVYASTSPIKRRDLWADFISLRPQTQVPWMAIGDFNAILGAHEQMGGGRPSQASCAEFSNMSDTCNFTYLNTSGAAFTRSNGWRSRGRTERRLDRSLCDISWFDSWPHSNCIALPKVVSDHNPLIFSALKTYLRQWNFSVFGDVHNRVANARHNLSMIQQRISTEGINNDLFEEEIVAKTTVMESLQMQEAFWKDRARVKWLTKGDRNSSFFHAYARIKSSSSHISCILDGNNLLTDPLAIENHIVNFYQTLFGSSFTPSGIDEVCEVIQPMVTDSENDLLSALPTDEEIKEAVFSLSASSAPGLDGFPDDLFIFCRSDGVTLRNLQGFFDRYSRASGQFINKAKSTFYLGSTSRHRKAVVESYLGFKEGKVPFVYLGVPIFYGKPKRSHLQALADKAKAKLTGWKGKLLSMAGRVQLTQSVFQSMLLHSFSVYKWPSSLLRPLSRCARNFIWSGDVTSKKSVTISWRQICAPKNEGGLGLRDLGSLNTTALLKLGWLIITTDSPWSIYLRERFKLHGRLYSCSYKRSSIWPGIKSILHILFQNCRWVIGNGSTTSLWVDKWLDKPIVDVVGATEIAHSLSRTKVSNIIRMGKWVIPYIFSSTFPDLTKEILEMPLPIDEDKDVLIWEVSTSGVFSFSDGYEIVRHRFPVKSWASIIWRPFIPPRYSILVWKILFNKLPTEDQLQRRGIPLAPICQLCHKNSESIDHLFSSCEFAQCA